MDTPPPIFNVERHNQIIAQIEKHPETWNQKKWHFGTAHCYGGWAQIFSGKEINEKTARKDAMEWLGLTEVEVPIAFNGFNTLEFLKKLPELFTYDKNGYSLDGFDRDGRDREGYDRDGRDPYGYNRYGWDRLGYDRDGRDPYGYNRYGWDRLGRHHPDYSYDGINKLNNRNPE
jgi:hypothetical protein